jgi:hypothetical protein
MLHVATYVCAFSLLQQAFQVLLPGYGRAQAAGAWLSLLAALANSLHPRGYS